jgi:hypothetical protein
MPIEKFSSLRVPADFTDHERFLLQKAEAALIDGLELERWCRDPDRKINSVLLDLKRSYALPNKAFGYLSEVKISGETRTLIGIRQEVEFGKATGPNPETQLKNYVLREFLPTSHWTYSDGWQGGFTFEQLLYCLEDGTLGRYPGDQRDRPQDWTLIGSKFRWSIFTTYLHDFVVKLGPVKKKFDEAVTLVQHPDFIHIVQNPAKGYKLEVAFGYPFLDFAPIPNYFGFGPGKFNWAVKLFSFMLRDNNEVQCIMDFAAGARAKKVFDFGKHIPDPLYGTSDALERITFGMYKSQRFHDWMDLNMAAQHGRVHQALMEGSAKIFAEWVKRPE